MFQWIDSLKTWFSQRLKRFLKPADVRKVADEAVGKTQEAIKVLTSKLLNKQITPYVWREQVAQEVMDGHIQQYLLGRGGLNQMGDADWRRVDAMIDRQYQFLEGFYADLVSGKSTGNVALVRAGMYGSAVGAGFASAVAANNSTSKESRWILSNVEHCQTCLQYAGMGWQKIGVLPVPLSAEAQTECMSRCQCHAEYR